MKRLYYEMHGETLNCKTPCPEDGTVKIGSCACRDCSNNMGHSKSDNWVDCAAVSDEKKDTTTPARGSILIEALQTINGERQDQYGNPEDSFAEIATRWERYIISLGWAPPACENDDTPLNAADVAHMMIEFKLARETNAPKRDNLLDAIGYAAIKADIIEQEKK